MALAGDYLPLANINADRLNKTAIGVESARDHGTSSYVPSPPTVPAPPTDPVNHIPQRDAFAVMMLASPTQTQNKKDSRDPVTFTVQSVVASVDPGLPTEPGPDNVAATEITATGSTAPGSTATARTATGFAPLLTVQIDKLDKEEFKGFCKLLKI